MKILLIDDDLTIRFTLKKLLHKYFGSLEIYTSEDGVKGLGLAYIIKPDLIIVDSTLPRYSGRELVEYFVSNEKFSRTPIFLLSESAVPFDNLPSNYTQVSKSDEGFPESLVSRLEPHLGERKSSRLKGFLNFLSAKIIKYSNRSDINGSKSESGNFFNKLVLSFKFLVDQFWASIYLSLFYLFLGRSDSSTPIKANNESENYRRRIYPSVALGMATLAIIFLQATFVIGVVLSPYFATRQVVNAASYTWDGGGATNNWSDCDNWSTNICPTSADTVTFNNTSTKDSVVDAGFGGTVASLTISAGYTGTITQERSLTISGAFTQSDGIYTAGANTLDIDTNFTLNTGAVFNASSLNSYFGHNFTINSGSTFNNNGGTVYFESTSFGGYTISCNNTVFNLVVFNASGLRIVSSNCQLPLGNNPSIPGSGGLTLNGTLTGSGRLSFPTGSPTFTINTGGTLLGFTEIQTHILIVRSSSLDFSSLTLLDVNNSFTLWTGATFTAPSTVMNTGESFTLNAGSTFNQPSGTLVMDSSGGGTMSCNGATFNLVSFTGGGVKTVSSNCNLPLGNNPNIGAQVTLNGTLSGSGTLTASSFNFNLGIGASLVGFSAISVSINFAVVGANIDLSTYSSLFAHSFTVSSGSIILPPYFSSNTLTTFSGGSVSCSSGTFAGHSISVTSATVNLSNCSSISLAQGITINSGSIALPSSADINGALTISGGTFTAPSGTMTLAGNLTISGTPTFNANGGTIVFDGGTATLSCNNVVFNIVNFNNSGVKTVNSNCNLPLGNNPELLGNSGITTNGVLSGSGNLTKLISVITMNSGSSLSGFNCLTLQNLTIAGANADFSLYDCVNVYTTTQVTSGSLTLNDTGNNINTLTISGGTLNTSATSVNRILSSLTTATQSSNQNHIINTPDGASHIFINTGTQNQICSGAPRGLLWLYSIDEGLSWICGGQVSDLASMFGSAVADQDGNIYLVYSTALNGGGVANHLHYRKLTKGVGQSWTLETQQTIANGSISTGYSYPVIEKEPNSNRLWIATRYYNGVQYSIPVYYSDNISSAPTWTISINSISNPGTVFNAHFPTIVNFSNKIGIAYLDNNQQVKWRFRSNNNNPSLWSGESIIDVNTGSAPSYDIVSTDNGYVFFSRNRGGPMTISYFDGQVWHQSTSPYGSGLTNLFSSLVTDGTNVWVIHPDNLNITNLTGSRRVSAIKCIPPYGQFNCTQSALNLVPEHNFFTRLWLHNGATFEDLTSQAINTTASDVRHSVSNGFIRSVGDSAYFGMDNKFGAIGWWVNTVGSAGVVRWEYCNSVDINDICTNWQYLPISSSSNPNITNSGTIRFFDQVDWVRSRVNTDSSPIYYVRAVVTTEYSTAPVLGQLNSIPALFGADFLNRVVNGKIMGIWTESSFAPSEIKFRSFNVESTNLNTASVDQNNSIFGYSNLQNATLNPSMKRFIKTTDGSLHYFLQAGGLHACGSATESSNSAGLNWIYSNDNGQNWICGGQIHNELNSTLLLNPSVTTDSNNNIYVVYSTVSTGGNAGFDLLYRKLSYQGSSSWNIGPQQLVLDSTLSTTGYSQGVIEVDSSRLWLAVRYFDGTNYQLQSYYSNNLTDSPTWTLSTSEISIASNLQNNHFPTMIRYSNRLGIVYSDDSTSNLKFRSRADSDPLTSWTTAQVVNTKYQNTLGNVALATDETNRIYLLASESNSGALNLQYYDGENWSNPSTVSQLHSPASFSLGIVPDNNALWLIFGEKPRGSDGNLISYRTMMKKAVFPFRNIDIDVLPTEVFPEYGNLDKVWAFVNGNYSNETFTASGILNSADVTTPQNLGDILYMGRSNKFDNLVWTGITAGSGGVHTWEYWNGSEWKALTSISFNGGFTGRAGAMYSNSHITFNPNSDWQPTSINGESSQFYYIRFRVIQSYSTPAGTISQIVSNPSLRSLSVIPEINNGKISATYFKDLYWPIMVGYKEIDAQSSSQPLTYIDSFTETKDSQGWWKSAWKNRKKLNFVNTEENLGIPSEELNDFTTLIQLNAQNFDFSKAKANGEDVRFVDSDDSTRLEYEIEEWDSSSQKATIWVRVPKIDQESEQDFIWIYYNNPQAILNHSPKNTWSDNYLSVWHLNQDPTQPILDSTINANTLRNVSGMRSEDSIVGRFGKAINFRGQSANADTAISGPGTSYRFDPSEDFTVSAWFRTTMNTSFPRVFTTEFNSPSRTAISLGINGSTGLLNFGVYNTCCNGAPGTTVVNDGVWHHVVGKRENGDLYLYVDGYLDGTPVSGGGVSIINARNISIGKDEINFFPSIGDVDEVRFSYGANSDAWIAAEYVNAEGGLVEFSNPETLSVPDPISQPDNTPPTGQILLAYVTDETDPNVYVITKVNDGNGTGVDKMIYSENPNFEGATYVNYQPSFIYRLSDGFGEKTLYIKFRDRAGNESIIYSDSIQYGSIVSAPVTTPPQTTNVIPFFALKFIDINNNPIVGMDVTLLELSITETTDTNGIASFENVRPGRYTILGVYNGVEFRREIDLDSNTNLLTIRIEEIENQTDNTVLVVITIISALVSVMLAVYIVVKKMKLKREEIQRNT